MAALQANCLLYPDPNECIPPAGGAWGFDIQWVYSRHNYYHAIIVATWHRYGPGLGTNNDGSRWPENVMGCIEPAKIKTATVLVSSLPYLETQ